MFDRFSLKALAVLAVVSVVPVALVARRAFAANPPAAFEVPESTGTPPMTDVPDAGPATAESTDDAIERRLSASDDAMTLPPVPSRLAAPPIAGARPLPLETDLMARAHLGASGRYVVTMNGREEPLTVNPAIQGSLNKILRDYAPPYAAVVVIEPKTGRILAMAEHSRADPAMRGLPVKAIFPAASVFKLVTATALMKEGVRPDEEECYHGGKHRLQQKLLTDTARDGRCVSIAMALARSANVVFAKQTLKHLTATKLRQTAQAFGFNKPFTFEEPVEMSLAAIPDDGFALASAGAGFGDVFLSPVHGAALAATIANGGVWRSPVLLEKDVTSSGPGDHQVMTAEQAATLADMMEMTVTVGTARRVFRERGHHIPGAVGKTGSLADRAPYRDYSWFVGFAPKDDPKVAVAAVIVNTPLWRIHAPFLAREAMRLALEADQRRVDSAPTAEPSSAAEGPNP